MISIYYKMENLENFKKWLNTEKNKMTRSENQIKLYEGEIHEKIINHNNEIEEIRKKIDDENLTIWSAKREIFQLEREIYHLERVISKRKDEENK